MDNFNFLLEHTVQTLYDSGYNDFLIDLSLLPEQTSSPGHLRGEIGEPLRMHCIGDVAYLGLELRYCKVSLEGSAQWIGQSSRWSEFTLSGRPVPLTSVGTLAKGCRFNLSSLAQLTSTYSHMRIDACPLECDYHIPQRRHGWKPRVQRLGEAGFFGRKNRLLVPNGRGGWKEVKP